MSIFFCNIIMVPLLCVHAKGTGWKIRPRPKTGIIKIKFKKRLKKNGQYAVRCHCVTYGPASCCKKVHKAQHVGVNGASAVITVIKGLLTQTRVLTM